MRLEYVIKQTILGIQRLFMVSRPCNSSASYNVTKLLIYTLSNGLKSLELKRWDKLEEEF